ncbi:barstar family protein [Streptomyces sp. NPDC003635]
MSAWGALFVPEGSAEAQRRLSELEAAGGRVRRVDARCLMTEQGVYDTFAGVFRFPGYFGGNWDAMVDCLDDLCGEVTGGVGVAGVIRGADRLLQVPHFALLVPVLCQCADRATSAVDLDGCPLDRAAIEQFFVFEFEAFDAERVALSARHPDLTVTHREGCVTAALDPVVWR